ncbi:transposase family protein [Candidatus Magnetobacterium bavaricum]|uniref:Transposase family protein n=1 Tax=Candidatus Magnetobacterium bavaricum TaxID=29290 RepID=A0A0F3GNT6_9BACT|nr:transposase family protein [Candidatus Magnetobacterium bavaricum]
MGKVDQSQVGVFVSYVNLLKHSVWTWVEGDLFIPEDWFNEVHAQLRKDLGIPDDLRFKTKIEIGLESLNRVIANGVPFEVICFDGLYGRSEWLRSQIQQSNHIYMAEIPCNTNVYLSKPQLGVPEIVQGKRGRHPKRLKVLLGQQPIKVRDLLNSGDLKWLRVRVRNSERGEINDAFAMQRVWLRYEDKVVEEWLIIRKESAKKHSYALCNASPDTAIQKLAWWKCQRYFIERANQDAKSEIGWDEFQAQKYRAWQHHLSLTTLACWFVNATVNLF